MERELSCTGVTMHKVAQRLDGGDVLAQHTIEHNRGHGQHRRLSAKRGMGARDGRGAPRAPRRPLGRRPAAGGEAALLEASRVRAADAAFRNEPGGGPGDLPKIQFHDSGGAGRRVVLCDRDRDRHGPLPCEVQRLSPTRALYRVRDGHLRLHIHPMEVRT